MLNHTLYSIQVHKAGGLDFECLQDRHFEAPKVVETYPYEALSVIAHGNPHTLTQEALTTSNNAKCPMLPL